jgi:AcrR family transcriptional regulator
MALTRERIVDATVELLQRHGAGAFSLRRLGVHLGSDPTAIYRHFKDKDDLLRAVGDRIHGQILVGLPSNDSWQAIVTEICIRLRASHLAQPEMAALIRSGPPLHRNEFELTEALFAQLGRSELPPPDQAMAYHALIELTVGSAALDTEVATMDAKQRTATYDDWRAAYQRLDPAEFPHTALVGEHMYRNSADERFVVALSALLYGFSRTMPDIGDKTRAH